MFWYSGPRTTAVVTFAFDTGTCTACGSTNHVQAYEIGTTPTDTILKYDGLVYSININTNVFCTAVQLA